MGLVTDSLFCFTNLFILAKIPHYLNYYTALRNLVIAITNPPTLLTLLQKCLAILGLCTSSYIKNQSVNLYTHTHKCGNWKFTESINQFGENQHFIILSCPPIKMGIFPLLRSLISFNNILEVFWRVSGIWYFLIALYVVF